jgi:hypothetical protein
MRGLTEPAVLPTKNQESADGSSESAEGGAAGKFMSWGSRHNAVFTVAAASVAPILYLLFIDRYATNSFNGDDWYVIPLLHAALHGHLSLSVLWGQFNESRLFVGHSIDVLFALVDRYDLRSVMFFSAALFVTSYVVLLALVRRYLEKRLTPIPVLVIGFIWFSLADVQNSLWAFQVSWYLTVFFFIAMQFALLVPDSRRLLWFAVAVLAAIAASLSTLQGFLCWPLGAVCILWSQPWTRRAVGEIAAWFSAAFVTIALYVPGYRFSGGCFPTATCSPSGALHHPLATLGFFFALIGNVVPGGFTNPEHSVARFEVVGAALFIVAVFILVQSWRYRTSRERIPLPLLLIAFPLAFDVTVAVGRSEAGPSGALTENRFVMANLILLAGIAIYVSARIPPRWPADNDRWRVYETWLVGCASAIFLVVQVTVATGFGLMNGRAIYNSTSESARIMDNVHHMPVQDLACEEYVLAFLGASFRDASKDQVGEFQPSSYRFYRGLGLPAHFCSNSK